MSTATASASTRGAPAASVMNWPVSNVTGAGGGPHAATPVSMPDRVAAARLRLKRPVCEHLCGKRPERITTSMPVNSPVANGLHDQARVEFVRSVSRVFAVIKAFASQPGPMTIADVARHTSLSRAVSRRFLLTLVELGYVAATDGSFQLTPRVLELGYTFLSTLTLPDVAQPIMEQVVRDLDESCSLSVLDGADIVYVARVPSKRIMTINLAVGSRLPAYATSMGRVLLAGLDPLVLIAHLRELTGGADPTDGHEGRGTGAPSPRSANARAMVD